MSSRRSPSQARSTAWATGRTTVRRGRFQGFSDLLGDGQSFVQGDWPLLNAIRQGRAFNEFEDQGPHAVRFFQAMDLRDVGVVQ